LVLIILRISKFGFTYKSVIPRDASFVGELSIVIVHNWTKHKPRRELSRQWL